MAPSLLLAGLASCSDAPEQAEASASLVPTQAELDSLKGDGLMQAARDASKLELFLHYKLMQANGLEQELGGEQQAVAALTAVSAAFERSATAAQTDVPRMIPASFDGNGLAVGVMGVGYGLVGGMIVGALSGNMTEQQVADAVKRGPLEADRDDGGARVEFSQGATDTAMTQTVNENGLTGTVKTRTHVDACPDADGKLVVEIESESQMSAGGKSGSVKIKLHYERWLDDDAERTDEIAFDMTTDMRGSGSGSNTLDYGDHMGASRDGTTVSEITHQQGLDIFHPEDVKTTEQLRDATSRFMIIVAEAMLAHKPWESGRCVDLKVRSDPAKRIGARPNTAYTLFAEPRSKLDGNPTRGTVTARLDGASTLNPPGKVQADARFDYANPGKKNESATVSFEARSRRGIGRAMLTFDTKESHAYRIVAGPYTFTSSDITQPFDYSPGAGAKLSFTPAAADGRSGTMAFRFTGGGGSANSSYSYTLTGPEDEMTGTLRSTSALCATGGMTRCYNSQPPTLGSTWTRIEACDGK
jgi:hypothetical protein